MVVGKRVTTKRFFHYVSCDYVFLIFLVTFPFSRNSKSCRRWKFFMYRNNSWFISILPESRSHCPVCEALLECEALTNVKSEILFLLYPKENRESRIIDFCYSFLVLLDLFLTLKIEWQSKVNLNQFISTFSFLIWLIINNIDNHERFNFSHFQSQSISNKNYISNFWF